ncbi:probably inactive leucine-rich repeat receptor-like protein kinase At5g48380 [Mercurialis annua]|uniref:probably inactive leucine-rich repeat receptor-like protein kinase At5g48380 n=1 Tax=Mercurialis annua TaxID=3986 RepID=UPI00215F4BD3|nr:probably inactive leucine-rich repeat receptor-like protein kinase At5g48380 [Mercurialis annua]
MEMTHKIRRRVILLIICSFLSYFTPTICTESDIACLKLIKASLQDPYGYFTSWTFNNNTEGFICRYTGVECWHPDENKIINLRLSDMGLKGEFPRGIKHCTSLTGLDLSSNELQGSIPSDIQRLLPYVTSLDLSSNNFSGEIPSSIADCSNLNALILYNNRLTGRIPQQIGLLRRIKTFSVAHNLLSGPVPNIANVSIRADSYANNSGLCGGPLIKRCKEHHHHQAMKFDFSFKGGFAIGYLVSVVTVIVVYASYCVPWVHSGQRNKMITVAAMILLMIRQKKKKEAEFDQFNSLSAMEFLDQMQVSTSEKFVTRMNFKDLSKATNDFSQHNIIELGEIGTTFKATLANGWSLAVKKFSNSQQSEEQFITELKTLGKLRHDNLLPLLGFCKESKKRLLVYKYMSRGHLFDWLHPTESENKKKILKWPLRVKIAAGVARALAWLHHCCEFRVAHLSISSQCILLDQNFEPKLSNFGMSSMINPKEVNASRGFCMDIEFWEECFIKEDVFSFGIVLLELITGKTATSLKGSDESMEKLITEAPSNSSLSVCDLMDEALIGQGHDQEIFQCLKIACNCVHSYLQKRPSMLDVYTTLSIISDSYEV